MTFNLSQPFQRPGVLKGSNLSREVQQRIDNEASLRAMGARLERQKLQDLLNLTNVSAVDMVTDRNRQTQAEMMENFIDESTELSQGGGAVLPYEKGLEIMQKRRGLEREQARMLGEEAEYKSGLGKVNEELQKINKDPRYVTPIDLKETQKRLQKYAKTGERPEQGFVAENLLDPQEYITSTKQLIEEETSKTETRKTLDDGVSYLTEKPNIEQFETEDNRINFLYQRALTNPRLQQGIKNEMDLSQYKQGTPEEKVFMDWAKKNQHKLIPSTLRYEEDKLPGSGKDEDEPPVDYSLYQPGEDGRYPTYETKKAVSPKSLKGQPGKKRDRGDVPVYTSVNGRILDDQKITLPNGTEVEVRSIDISPYTKVKRKGKKVTPLTFGSKDVLNYDIDAGDFITDKEMEMLGIDPTDESVGYKVDITYRNLEHNKEDKVQMTRQEYNRLINNMKQDMSKKDYSILHNYVTGSLRQAEEDSKGYSTGGAY